MFCTATGPLRLAVARQQAGLPQLENYVIEPTRVFDNMYFIGMSSQNAWAITTSEGIILIDTLNNTEEARDILVPGLKKVGLIPPGSNTSSSRTVTRDRPTIRAALHISSALTAPR